MAKGSKSISRYKLHNSKQKTVELASTDFYSNSSDIEFGRTGFRIKSSRGKIFHDGKTHNENGSNRQNGNKNHRPRHIPY